MPPVTLYTNAPITATKAEGVTPKTAAPGDGANDSEATQTTSRHQGLPEYVPAHPTPTRTTNTTNYGPPPPQPGAVPRLPTATATSNLPPPPRASSSSSHQVHYPGITPPPQMSIPQPTIPYGQRGTMPATVGPGPGTSTNLSHPPGYRQRADPAYYGRPEPGQSADLSHPPGYQQRTDPSGFQNRYDNYGNPNRTGDSGDGSQESEEGGGVWGFLQAAGKKLSDAETEVWRRINKE